jgi:hypothetical protein
LAEQSAEYGVRARRITWEAARESKGKRPTDRQGSAYAPGKSGD